MKRLIIIILILLLATFTIGCDIEMSTSTLLPSSGKITITKNNQIVRNIRITSIDGNGISCSGYSNIKISNVVILYDEGHGIYLNGCDGAEISNVNLLFTGAPASGPNNYTERNCIEVYNSKNLVVNNILATDCSSGIYTIKSDAPSISFIKCVNMRGPYPRGQCVQFNQSNNFSLSDFYSYNDLSIAWTNDNISVFQSSNGIIRRGVIDGNNRTNGSGIAVEDSSSNVTVSDVDVYRWCNCAYSASNGTKISFIRVHASDSYKPCTQGAPASGTGIVFISYNFKPFPPTVETIFSQAQYFNLASGNKILYDGNPSTIAIKDIIHFNFTKRIPIVPVVPSIYFTDTPAPLHP